MFHWLFHTSIGVLVLILALMVICFVLAAILERGTKRKYADRGPREKGESGVGAVARAARQKASDLADKAEAAIDERFSEDEDADDEGADKIADAVVSAGERLGGALQELWDAWDVEEGDK